MKRCMLACCLLLMGLAVGCENTSSPEDPQSYDENIDGLGCTTPVIENYRHEPESFAPRSGASPATPSPATTDDTSSAAASGGESPASGGRETNGTFADILAGADGDDDSDGNQETQAVREVLLQAARAIEDGDEQAFIEHLNTEGEAAEAMYAAFHASSQFARAFIEAYPQGEDMLEEVFRKDYPDAAVIDRMKVVVEGDTAQAMPADMNGMPISLVKVEGEWKIGQESPSGKEEIDTFRSMAETVDKARRRIGQPGQSAESVLAYLNEEMNLGGPGGAMAGEGDLPPGLIPPPADGGASDQTDNDDETEASNTPEQVAQGMADAFKDGDADAFMSLVGNEQDEREVIEALFDGLSRIYDFEQEQVVPAFGEEAELNESLGAMMDPMPHFGEEFDIVGRSDDKAYARFGRSTPLRLEVRDGKWVGLIQKLPGDEGTRKNILTAMEAVPTVIDRFEKKLNEDGYSDRKLRRDIAAALRETFSEPERGGGGAPGPGAPGTPPGPIILPPR